MNQEIHTHLEKLKTELEKLEPAVKNLQKADENAAALINSFGNIHKEFSFHLKNIEKLLLESIREHQNHITNEIQASTKKIIYASESFTNSSISFEKHIMSLLEENKHLSSETNKLIANIDKIDFPSRFEKLDVTVSSFNQEIQNAQQLIGDLEKNLKDDFQEKTRDIIIKIESIENSLKQQIENSRLETKSQFENQTKENKLLKFLLFFLIGLCIVNIIIIFIRTV